jgi:hypothetical protein
MLVRDSCLEHPWYFFIIIWIVKFLLENILKILAYLLENACVIGIIKSMRKLRQKSFTMNSRILKVDDKGKILKPWSSEKIEIIFDQKILS